MKIFPRRDGGHNSIVEMIGKLSLIPVVAAMSASCFDHSPSRFRSDVEILRNHADPNRRAFAATVLGDQGSDARHCLPDLKDALGDKDSMVRVEAAFAIWRIDPKEIPIAMPVLVKEIDSTVSLSANTAMIHLGSIGPAAVDAIPGLTNVLKRAESCYQRVLAAAALAEIDRPNCKLTIPVLREGLKDKQATQMAAAAALRRMGPAAREAVPDLKALLLSDDEVARDAASRALKAIEPPR